jgi:hypothetical protein
MPLVSLISAKGSPGVTTSAVALAAAARASGTRAAWVELDPSGGTGWVQTRASRPGSRPTLGEFARALRDDSVGDWSRFTVEAPPGVPAVLAPPGRPAVSTILGEGRTQWTRALGSRSDMLAVADAGRWGGRQDADAAVVGADVVGLVCRSTLLSAEHTLRLVAEVQAIAQCPVLVVVVGTKPYDPREVASAIGLPLAGSIEWRRRDVAALWAAGTTRTVLVRSAGRTLRGLLDAIPSSTRTRTRRMPSGPRPDPPAIQARRRA